MAEEPVQGVVSVGGFGGPIGFDAGQSWARRAALTCAGIVILLILLVIVVPAVVAGVLIFLLASAVSWVRHGLRRDGRRNVRVLPPQAE